MAGLVTPWGPRLEQSAPDGLDPQDRSAAEQLVKNCGLWEGLADPALPG